MNEDEAHRCRCALRHTSPVASSLALLILSHLPRAFLHALLCLSAAFPHNFFPAHFRGFSSVFRFVFVNFWGASGTCFSSALLRLCVF